MTFGLARSSFALFQIITRNSHIHIGVYDPRFWVFGAGWEQYDWCMFLIGLGPVFSAASLPGSRVSRTIGTLCSSAFSDIVGGLQIARGKMIGLSFSRTGVRVEDYEV